MQIGYLTLILVVLSLTHISTCHVTQLTQFSASGSKGFGSSLAKSGNLVAVGAPSTNAYQGAAYIFNCTLPDPCIQIVQLVALDGKSNDLYGSSIAIDGPWVVIGSHQAKVNSKVGQGSAYVYHCLPDTLTQNLACSLVTKLFPDDGEAEDYFGVSVALRGSTVFVGSYQSNVNSMANQGAVYAYHCTSFSCSKIQKIVANDGNTDDSFGFSLAVSGNLLAIGSYRKSSPGIYSHGSVYLFNCSSVSCSQASQLEALDKEANDIFGWSISIFDEYVVVGSAYDDTEPYVNRGSAYVFECNSSFQCEQVDKLYDDEFAANDYFGFSVSMQGSWITVGAVFDEIQGKTLQGSLTFFDCSSFPCSKAYKLTRSDGEPTDNFGSALILEDGILFASSRYDSMGDSQGSVNIFSFGPSPCPADSVYPQTNPGSSVNLNNCPAGKYGETVRTCSKLGFWGNINFSNCQYCPVGYTSLEGSDLSSDCNIDLNECPSNPCSNPFTYCLNTIGSYQCPCLPGYDFDGTSCQATQRTSYLASFSPIARFLLDGNFQDSSGKSHIAKIVPSGSLPNGKLYQRNNSNNRALRLIGSEKVVIPSITLTDKFTIEILFNIQNSTPIFDLVYLLPSPSSSKLQSLMGLSVSSQRKLRWTGPNGILISRSRRIFRMGVTHSLVVSVRQGKIVTFVDDIQLGTWNMSILPGTYSLVLANGLNGYLDEVGVYSVPIYSSNSLNDLNQCVNTCPNSKVCVNNVSGYACQPALP